jgi:hypothetical protein
MTDDTTRIEVDEDVELGEQVENASAGRSKGAVVAVRVPPDLLARLQEYATARGLSLSEVVRRGAEQLVTGTVQVGPTFVTGGMVSGLNVMNGSPSTGTGRSRSENAHDRPEELTVSG